MVSRFLRQLILVQICGMNVMHKITMAGSQTPINAPLTIAVSSKGNTCFISISGHISEWGNASAAMVSKDIKAAKEAGADSCQIYVNSVGGNVFEANEIANLIEDNFSADNITVKVGALCASAGTIFPSKYHATGKKNTQCMIHKPSMHIGGNEDEINAGLTLLKDLTNQYKAMYAKKFGIDEDAVEALWQKGDYWMNAKQAKKMGLLDVVEDEDEAIDATTHLQLVACGAPEAYTPERKTDEHNENPKPIKMELSVLAVQLGLPSTASQAEVDAKLKEVQAQAAEAQTLRQAAEDNAKAEMAGKIKNLLDQAEKDKKIDANMRSNYEAIGNSSFENLEAILKTVKPVQALSTQLESGAGATASGDDRAKWTFADYQEKAPEAFVKLSETDPKKAEALMEAHYKE